MGKYDPLGQYLFTSGSRTISLSFDQVGELVRGGLPWSAYQYQAWWANEREPRTHVHKQAWMAAGYVVDVIDLNTQRVRFRKVRSILAPSPASTSPLRATAA